MKKFGQGLIVGFLLATLLISGIAWASNPIKLIVNGQEIKTDVAPQMINSRVFVPVRFVAEALGAQVEWDPENWAVIITSAPSNTNGQINSPIETEQPKTYKIGEIIDLSDTKIRVNEIYYGETFDTIVARNGMKFALANMDIWIAMPPKNNVAWSGINFINSWHTKSGQELRGGSFTTGESAYIKEKVWNNIIVAIEIQDSDEITAVIVRDPIAEKSFKVSY